jgi:ferredoxin-NADP reductase
MAKTTFDLVLRRHAEEVPNVRRFTFQRADGAPLPFVPGQFLMLHYEDAGGAFQRSYSLSSLVASEPDPEMVVSFVDDGRGCRALWALEPGDTVSASGPYGRFTLRDETPKRYVFVGTGTGVAPYRTMLPELAARAAAGVEIHVVEGVRRCEELLFGDDFRAFAAAHPNVTFHACYSREDAPVDESDAMRGYVTERLRQLAPTPDEDIVYLCGNPAMVDDSVAYLLEHQFSPRNIRREKYISS